MIDAIYCVSLSRTVIRRKKMIEMLSSFQDIFDVYFFEAVDWKKISVDDFYNEGFSIYDSWKIEGHWNKWYSKDLRMGSLCNLLGHYSIWKHILKSNYESALILEDDVAYTNGEAYFVEGLNIAYDFIKNNNCDIFYLSCWPVDGYDHQKINDKVEKIDYTYNAHSYIVTNDAARELSFSGIDKNLITNDEYITSTYCEHPREDIRNLYRNRKLNAYRLMNDVIDQYIGSSNNTNHLSEIETSDYIKL